MKHAAPIATAIFTALLVSGCAVKPLKAPCSSSEGDPKPMAYATAAAKPDPFAKLDHCGPMKPVNEAP